MRIGYSSSDGLYANPDQTVQVSYYADGNVLTGLILDWLIPFQSAKTDLQIVDIQSDGSLALRTTWRRSGRRVVLWVTPHLHRALFPASSEDTLEGGGKRGGLVSMGCY